MHCKAYSSKFRIYIPLNLQCLFPQIFNPHQILAGFFGAHDFWHTINRVGGFRPLTHHRTCLLWHTAVSRRVIGPGTTIPAATLYLSSSDTLTTPPHRYVDSDLHRFPSLDRGFVHFSTSWLCCCMF